LKVQQSARLADRVVYFDRLGIYRLLADVRQTDGIELFVREWLGALLDYDRAKRTDLVSTVACYLENGGNYEATAAALAVHRSTLKYRLQRIRKISGRDLSDPDTQFHLQLASRARQTLMALGGEA
jgi:DNA-binding PucR family transcriptional regulator